MSFMSSMFGGSGSPSGQSVATAQKMISDQAIEQKKLEDEAASYDPLIADAITRNLGLVQQDKSRREAAAKGNQWSTTGYTGVAGYGSIGRAGGGVDYGSSRTLGQTYLLGT